MDRCENALPAGDVEWGKRRARRAKNSAAPVLSFLCPRRTSLSSPLQTLNFRPPPPPPNS